MSRERVQKLRVAAPNFDALRCRRNLFTILYQTNCSRLFWTAIEGRFMLAIFDAPLYHFRVQTGCEDEVGAIVIYR